jgi:hypothetical protein
MRAAVVIATILAAMSIAHAGSKERHPPCVCAPPGPKTTVLLEVRWHSAGTKVVSRLFSTGMWTRQVTGGGGITTTKGGKLETTLLDEVKRALEKAPWKVTRARTHCKATDPDDEATEFYVGGHKRYTRSACGDAVDARTEKLIALVGSRIEFAQPIQIDEEI